MSPQNPSKRITKEQATAFAAELEKCGVSGAMLDDIVRNNDAHELTRWIYLRRLSYVSLRGLPFAKDRELVKQEVLGVLAGGAKPFASPPMKLDTLRTIILGRGFDPQTFGLTWMELYRVRAVEFTGRDRRLLSITKKGREMLAQLEATSTTAQ